MATVDISGLSYFMPLFSFMLVFVIVYAVLNKTKIVGENKWAQIFVAFLVSTFFIVAARPTDYVISVVPWFAVLLVSAFLVLALTGFIGGLEDWGKGVGKIFVVIMLIIFLVAAYYAFAGTSELQGLKDWASSSNVFGTVIILAVSAVAGWVLVNAKK